MDTTRKQQLNEEDSLTGMNEQGKGGGAGGWGAIYEEGKLEKKRKGNYSFASPWLLRLLATTTVLN